MATESVDEILTIAIRKARFEGWERGKDQHATPYDYTLSDENYAKEVFNEAKQRLDTYITRECARKVLEGRLTELEQLYDPNDGIMASHYIYLTDGAADEINNALKARIAELRAAIEEVGSGDGNIN